jgi:hypothetical protein
MQNVKYDSSSDLVRDAIAFTKSVFERQKIEPPPELGQLADEFEDDPSTALRRRPSDLLQIWNMMPHAPGIYRDPYLREAARAVREVVCGPPPESTPPDFYVELSVDDGERPTEVAFARKDGSVAIAVDREEAKNLGFEYDEDAFRNMTAFRKSNRKRRRFEVSCNDGYDAVEVYKEFQRVAHDPELVEDLQQRYAQF